MYFHRTIRVHWDVSHIRRELNISARSWWSVKHRSCDHATFSRSTNISGECRLEGVDPLLRRKTSPRRHLRNWLVCLSCRSTLSRECWSLRFSHRWSDWDSAMRRTDWGRMANERRNEARDQHNEMPERYVQWIYLGCGDELLTCQLTISRDHDRRICHRLERLKLENVNVSSERISNHWQ